MNSLVVAGKVLDYKFIKQSNAIYAFYLGDQLIGQCFRMSRYWSCVSYNHHRMGSVSGFKTRILAADYMLKLGGFVL